MADRHIIPNRPYSDTGNRVYAGQPIGGAVRNRSVTIVNSDDVVNSLTASLGAGAGHLFEVVVATDSGDRMQAVIEQTLFVGTSVNVDTMIPNGASVPAGVWQVYGPSLALMKADGTAVGIDEQVFHTYVRTPPLVTANILYQYRVRYISNRGNAIA